VSEWILFFSTTVPRCQVGHNNGYVKYKFNDVGVIACEKRFLADMVCQPKLFYIILILIL